MFRKITEVVPKITWRWQPLNDNKVLKVRKMHLLILITGGQQKVDVNEKHADKKVFMYV